jgi:predicted RNA binding protein YcfA (HicA-like mRNA interferase family)
MAGRLPRVTAAQVLRALNRDGWYIDRQAGSHVTLSHPTKPGHVNVPRHAGRIIKLGTLTNILARAGLSPEQFRRLL